MKIKWHVWLFCLGACLLSSCKDIQVGTRIFRDGSCERTVACTADSGRVPISVFPVPSDSTWQSEFVRNLKDSTHKIHQAHIYQAHKTFGSVAELNAYYQTNKDSALAFHSKISLDKKFRWFYTYLTYRETYCTFTPFKLVPITKYIRLDELSGGDEKERNKKVDQWLEQAVFEELYLFLNSHLPLGDLTKERLAAQKKALYKVIMDTNEGDDAELLLQACANVLGSPAVLQLKEPAKELLAEIEKKISFSLDLEQNSYKNSVEMPGLILATNSTCVVSRQVNWQIDPRQFEFQDYEMWVTSRVINTWAFIVSGLVGAGLLVLLLAALLRRPSGVRIDP
jgi:hypothetical protein